MTGTFEPFETANSALGDHVQLTATLEERGYLFVRGLIEPSKIARLRLDMRNILLDNGYVTDDPHVELKWSGKAPDGDELTPGGRVGRLISDLPSLQDVIHTAELRQFLQDLFGGEVDSWVENADRVRVQFLSDMSATTGGQKLSYTTPAHQDGYHFRVQFVTAWIPLMDIGLKTGGLTLCKGSHKQGMQQHWWHGSEYLGIAEDTHHARELAAQGGTVVAGEVEPHDRPKTWLRSDYEAGDALIFHPHMVHKGVGNTSQQLRLSADFRYQRQGAPTVWQASLRLFETHDYLNQSRKCLELMQVEPSIADLAWELMRREGPSSQDTVQTQAEHLVQQLTQTSP